MNRSRRSKSAPGVSRSAAAWFVALDQGELTRAQSREFENWLLADPRHKEALARCAHAVELGAHIDPAQYPAPAGMPSGIAAGRGRFGGRLAAWLRPLGQPAVAWSITAAALIFAFASWLHAPPAADTSDVTVASTVSDAPTEPAASTAVHLAFDNMPMGPVVLPGNLVVDALSFGVRRFLPAHADDVADRRAANELYDRMTLRLASVPGFYVLGAGSTDPYAALDVEPVTVATQLGVRAIVQGTVSAQSGEIHLDLRLIDASRNVSFLIRGQSQSMAGVDALLDDMLQDISDAITGPMRVSAAWNEN